MIGSRAVDEGAFNPDELTAQALAGGGPRGNGIHDFMTEQHRLFFAQLPYVFVGVVDGNDWPVATLLTGESGFVQSPDSVTLHIAALPDADDPAAEAFAPNRDIGILGIDFSTRRRNRANGHILDSEPIGANGSGGIRVAVSQSFGNCPQYIQQRTRSPRSALRRRMRRRRWSNPSITWMRRRQPPSGRPIPSSSPPARGPASARPTALIFRIAAAGPVSSASMATC